MIPLINSEVAIAVLNFNGRILMKKYLPDLIRHSQNADIFIIDNQSTDDSIAYIQSNFPQIQIVELEKNYGFAGGYNHGMDSLREYPFTVLLNSDVRVTQGWLDPLLTCLKSNPCIGSVQPKILSDENPAYFEYAGACGGFISTLGYPYCRGRIFETIEKDEGQYDVERYVDWTSGAAMMIRTHLFFDLHKFDPTYFAHQEEIDYCWRMRSSGYSCRVVPSSVVYHLGGGTLNYQSERKVFLNFKNNLSTIIKNERPLSLFWKLPIRIGLDIFAALRFLTKGQILNTWAIIKALILSLTQILITINNRRKYGIAIKKVLHQSPQEAITIESKNILLPYFIQGKKKYSDY